MDEIDKTQGKNDKAIVTHIVTQLLISTPYTGIDMETELWPANENVEYRLRMLY